MQSIFENTVVEYQLDFNASEMLVAGIVSPSL
jgi:hypothetical protein